MNLPLRSLFWVALILILICSPAAGADVHPFRVPQPSELKNEVDRAAREFRLHAYQNYRSNRLEFDRRMEIGGRVWDQWQDSDGESQDAVATIGWFEQAATVGLGGYFPPLPIKGSQQPTTQLPLAHDTGSPSHASPVKAALPSTSRWLPPDIVTGPVETQLNVPPTPIQRITHTPQPSNVSTVVSVVNSPTNEREANDAAIDTEPATNGEAASPPLAQTDSPQQRPTESSLSKQVDSVQAPVDCRLLDAKIRAANYSLQGLESELTLDRIWSLNELEAAADLFEQRLREIQLAQTYLDVLNPDQRDTIQPVIDVEPLLVLFAQRTFEVKIQFADDDTANQSVSARADRITDRIQAWRKENTGSRPDDPT